MLLGIITKGILTNVLSKPAITCSKSEKKIFKWPKSLEKTNAKVIFQLIDRLLNWQLSEKYCSNLFFQDFLL